MENIISEILLEIRMLLYVLQSAGFYMMDLYRIILHFYNKGKIIKLVSDNSSKRSYRPLIVTAF